MKVIRVLSIISLASYLVLQGLYYLALESSPLLHAAIGILGLGAGALMFISLGHWTDLHKEEKR
ncbi:MAG: hypothetical protein WAM28_07510 [Chlamydiales bacterium]